MEHFFAYTSRMRFISRWALMRNSQPENIQEHSHQVSAGPCAGGDPQPPLGGQVDPVRWRWRPCTTTPARSHRGSAYPIKYYNPAIRDAYKQVEQSPAASWWGYCRRSCGRTLPRP